MEADGKAEATTAPEEERRGEPRLPVDEDATLLLLNQSSSMVCRVVELSLTGCRIKTRDRFLAGTLVRVEAAFKISGIDFRFSGVTEWTDGKHLLGIRFLDLTARRRKELVDVLCEVAAANAVKAVRQAAERLAAEEEAARLAAPVPGKTPETVPARTQEKTPEKTQEKTADKPQAGPQPNLQPPQKPALARPTPLLAGSASRPAAVARALPELAKVSALPPRAAAAPAPSAPAPSAPLAAAPVARALPAEAPRPAQPPEAPVPAKPSGRDRRTQVRHDVDTTAIVLLVNVGARLHGRILNLSLGGCRIRTDERFPVGIYTRVETEFHLEGLPFRLGGVIQAIQDRHNVGIRFLDMSERRREQVHQLMEEIEEMKQRQKPAEGSGSEPAEGGGPGKDALTA
jgi:c-di-GMP-binding flagellar brake protein YcgR